MIACQQDQCRAEPFAAGLDDVTGNLIDQNDIRRQSLADDAINGDHIEGDFAPYGIQTDRVMRQIHEVSLDWLEGDIAPGGFSA